MSPEFGRSILLRFLILPIAAVLIPQSLAHASAPTDVEVAVDISTERMEVSIDGVPTYGWVVSTARPGYQTPTGDFRPIRLERMWHSTLYDNAPMPDSIFFDRGYAIHGTTEVRGLGKPVSHGCVRLDPADAQILFQLVNEVGPAKTSISIMR